MENSLQVFLKNVFCFCWFAFFLTFIFFSLQFLHLDCFPVMFLKRCSFFLQNVASFPELAQFSSLQCFFFFNVFFSNFSWVYKCHLSCGRFGRHFHGHITSGLSNICSYLSLQFGIRVVNIRGESNMI